MSRVSEAPTTRRSARGTRRAPGSWARDISGPPTALGGQACRRHSVRAWKSDEVWRRDSGHRDPSRPRPGSGDDVGHAPEVRCGRPRRASRCHMACGAARRSCSDRSERSRLRHRPVGAGGTRRQGHPGARIALIRNGLRLSPMRCTGPARTRRRWSLRVIGSASSIWSEHGSLRGPACFIRPVAVAPPSSARERITEATRLLRLARISLTNTARCWLSRFPRRRSRPAGGDSCNLGQWPRGVPQVFVDDGGQQPGWTPTDDQPRPRRPRPQ